MTLTILFFTYLTILSICTIFSLKVFRLNWPLAYKLFSCFLIFALLTDALGTLWQLYLYKFEAWRPFGTDNNHWIITLGIIPQYLLLISVYREVLQNKHIKKVIIVIAGLYVGFSIFNLGYWQGIKQQNSYSHIVASFIMLYLVFAYFEQIRKAKELINLKTNPMVWISFGIFIYHLINIPFLFSMNYLVVHHQETATTFFAVYLVVLIITYLLYIKSLLCPAPKQQ